MKRRSEKTSRRWHQASLERGERTKERYRGKKSFLGKGNGIKRKSLVYTKPES